MASVVPAWLKAPVMAPSVFSVSPRTLSTDAAIGSSLSVKREIWPVASETVFEIEVKSASACSSFPEAASMLPRIPVTFAWFSVPTMFWNSRTSLIDSCRRSGASSVSDWTTERSPGMTGTSPPATRISGAPAGPGLIETNDTPVTPWAWS